MPMHIWQIIVIIIYCIQIIVNIYLDQLIDIIMNIDVGIQDSSGILFKEVIFALERPSTEMTIIDFSLFIAFVL